MLRLFRSLPLSGKEVEDTTFTPPSVQEQLSSGFIVDASVILTKDYVDAVQEVCVSGKQLNSTFYTSWNTIVSSGDEELWADKCAHYLQTYGRLGKAQTHIHIPLDQLGLYPIGTADTSASTLPILHIGGMNLIETTEAILKLVASGMPLCNTTLDDLMVLIRGNDIPASSIMHLVNNREFSTRLYEHYDMTPMDPEEFLRFIVYKCTGLTLLIKNDFLLQSIMESEPSVVDKWMERAPMSLGSIFYRYRPIFLALRKVAKDKSRFNRIRRAAKTQHQPVTPSYFNTITHQLDSGELNPIEFEARLRSAHTLPDFFKKAKLAKALAVRLSPSTKRLYPIRNGKAWACDRPESASKNSEMDQWALNTVKLRMADHLVDAVKDQKIYIPEHMSYACPTSEKQFSGYIPNGSYVEHEGLMVGIHWFNIVDAYEAVDLDLSAVSEGGKIGWDGDYRNDDRSILFSGDLTTAPYPDGASEFMFFRENTVPPMITFVNYYNYNTDRPCKYKVMIGFGAGMDELPRGYMLDPANVLLSLDELADVKQTMIGCHIVVDGKARFYLNRTELSSQYSAGESEHNNNAIQAIMNNSLNSTDLSELLIMAGALVTSNASETVDIDLSPDKLDKTSFINLISN